MHWIPGRDDPVSYRIRYQVSERGIHVFGRSIRVIFFPSLFMIPNGLGYMPPEVWEEWQAALVAGGDLPAPLDDLSAAYTNAFVEKLNAEMK